MSKPLIGIQLYTVRDALEDDFKGTLKALADMGYDGVEFAWNYGGMTPEVLAAFLNEIGLMCCGVHARGDSIVDPESEHYAYALALKSPCITTSMQGKVAEGWDDAISIASKVGAVATAKGMAFTYHNHDQELEKIGDATALDLLYAKTDPTKVLCELDIYWIQKGGEDPLAYVRKYSGRQPQLHVKDMDAEDGSWTEVGHGILDMPAIINAAIDGGTKWLIYEQDVCKRPALESARMSIETIKRIVG
jgi:sugar phosphate isomerase/epimerase